jgi:hypothetical protein
VRDCNKKLSVVANFDCICVVEIYLVIWYMIASLVVCVIAKTVGYFVIAKKN